MTLVISEDPQVKALLFEKVISYVEKTGWKRVPHPNDNIEVFQGKVDDFGQPIQLVLPKHPDLWDSSILLAKAINLLAAIEEKSPQEILAAIQLKSDVNMASAESAPSPLTRKALLQKLNELSHLPKQEVAKRSGYYSVTKNNQTHVNLIKDSRDRKRTYRVSVDKNGQIAIGASYTRAMGLKPGDEFEVKLGYKRIILFESRRSDG